jgi:hypothetical protein
MTSFRVFQALFFMSLSYFALGQTCWENDPNCDATSGACYQNPTNGYWRRLAPGNETKCTDCTTGYNISTSCTTCIAPNFDPAKSCASCRSGFYGSNCATECNTATCNPLGGTCSSTGSCQCFGNSTQGYWEGIGCAGCVNNFNISTNCTKCNQNWMGDTCSRCVGNFDETQNCERCRPGWFGPKCDMTCDAATKCNGNGYCSADDCICFNDKTRGYWDVKTNCKTCLAGWTGDGCNSAICSRGPNGICNGRGECTDPEECKCNPFSMGEKCQHWLCFDIPQNETTKACGGQLRSSCVGFNDCYCNWGWRGSDCSESYIAQGWGISLQILIGIAVFSVLLVFATIACLFRKKVENPTRADQINWVELQESDEEISGLPQ